MAVTNQRSRDMLSLAKADLAELLVVLEEEATFVDDPGGPIPRRSKRVARRILAEAVRLIRLGTRKEVADAALLVAEALTQPTVARFEGPYPTVYRMVTSAADVLAAATPASSGGGELTVLRSWKGRARKAVAIVNQARDQAVPRADLRVQLGVSEDYLSHLLADLEAAGLVARVRSGKTVMVHLGLVGRSDHVQELLPQRDPHPEMKAGTHREQVLRGSFKFSRFQYGNEPQKPDNELLRVYAGDAFGNFESSDHEFVDTDLQALVTDSEHAALWLRAGVEDQAESSAKPLAIARKDHLVKV